MYQNYNNPATKMSGVTRDSELAVNARTLPVDSGLGTKVQPSTVPNVNARRIRRQPGAQTPQPTDLARDQSLATVTALSLVSSAIVIFAPVSSVWRVMEGRAGQEEIVGLAGPYYFLFGQGYFWALFGMEADNADIANINIFGSVVCVLYLVVLAAFGGGPDEGQKNKQHGNKGVVGQTGMTVRALLGYGVLLCAVISAFELLVEDAPLRSELLAYTALIYNISIFLYPMRQCADAIRTQSTVGFPVALSVAGFVSCALWAQYSALTHNYEYLIPNCLGLLCNGCQICVIGWIYIYRTKGMNDDFLRFDARFSEKKAAMSKDTSLHVTSGSGEQEFIDT